MRATFVDSSSCDLNRITLVESSRSSDEIVELGHSVSMALRESGSFATFQTLLSRRLAFEKLGLPLVRLPNNIENDFFQEEHGSRPTLSLTKSDGRVEFAVFFKRPGEEFFLNKEISRLLAHCLLHTDYADRPNGTFLYDASNSSPSEGVMAQASCFSNSFRYPKPLVDKHLNCKLTSEVMLSSLLGGSLAEMMALRRTQGGAPPALFRPLGR